MKTVFRITLLAGLLAAAGCSSSSSGGSSGSTSSGSTASSASSTTTSSSSSTASSASSSASSSSSSGSSSSSSSSSSASSSASSSSASSSSSSSAGSTGGSGASGSTASSSSGSGSTTGTVALNVTSVGVSGTNVAGTDVRQGGGTITLTATGTALDTATTVELIAGGNAWVGGITAQTPTSLTADFVIVDGMPATSYGLRVGDGTSTVISPAVVNVTPLTVAITGSDSATGTPSDPFRTLTHALSLATAGDDGGIEYVDVGAGLYDDQNGEVWPTASDPCNVRDGVWVTGAALGPNPDAGASLWTTILGYEGADGGGYQGDSQHDALTTCGSTVVSRLSLRNFYIGAEDSFGNVELSQVELRENSYGAAAFGSGNLNVDTQSHIFDNNVGVLVNSNNASASVLDTNFDINAAAMQLNNGTLYASAFSSLDDQAAVSLVNSGAAIIGDPTTPNTVISGIGVSGANVLIGPGASGTVTLNRVAFSANSYSSYLRDIGSAVTVNLNNVTMANGFGGVDFEPTGTSGQLNVSGSTIVGNTSYGIKIAGTPGGSNLAVGGSTILRGNGINLDVEEGNAALVNAAGVQFDPPSLPDGGGDFADATAIAGADGGAYGEIRKSFTYEGAPITDSTGLTVNDFTWTTPPQFNFYLSSGQIAFY